VERLRMKSRHRVSPTSCGTRVSMCSTAGALTVWTFWYARRRVKAARRAAAKDNPQAATAYG
jgi:hypothetical protein